MTHGHSRARSLGILHSLSDFLLIECILTRLGPKDLCTLSVASRYLYVFARNDFLWRHLFFAGRDHSSTRLVFRGSWLLTCMFPSPEQNEACMNHPLVTQPVRIEGVESEYLHRQWVRSNMFFGHFHPPPSLPSAPALGDKRAVNLTIALEDYQSLDKDTFYRRYAYPNRPVMIHSSGVESWPAWEQWTLDALAAQHGDTLFRVSNIDSDVQPTFQLCFKDFLHYLKNNKDQDPLYLFDPCFAETVPSMGSAYTVPKYFEIDFFSLLKNEARPPFRWILIGPQRTGAPWHVDPSGTSAWNTLLSGHKRWALYPPHITPPGHEPLSAVRMSSVAWYLDVYPFLPLEARPFEIVQYPGQTIYIPSGWWHMVLNMDHTVAVTQNFADETNLLRVMHALLADKTEYTQVHRWKALAEEIPRFWPELAPAVQAPPEVQLLLQFQGQPSWLDPHSAGAAIKWQERASQVLQMCTGVANPGEIRLIETGHNVCFLSNVGFVKFFTPFHDGHASFLSEAKANIALLAASEQTAQDPVLSIPKMLGYGYWLGTEEAETSDWRWPYVVTESKLHSGSDERLSKRPLVEAREFMPHNEQGYEALLPPILQTLQYLHALHTTLLFQDEVQEVCGGARTSPESMTQRLGSAASNHSRWRIFPKHLLKQLPGFLPSDARQIFDPASGHAVATLVHGDITPSNILGYMDSARAFSASTSSGKVDAHACEKLPSELHALTEDRTLMFQPTSLIDFGDAIFMGDPLVDLVSVFVTVLNCQRDLQMIPRLLDYWRILTKNTQPVSGSHKTLTRRCIWHVLLWPSEGLCLHLVRCVPEIGEMSTWQQVEEALFGWWSSL